MTRSKVSLFCPNGQRHGSNTAIAFANIIKNESQKLFKSNHVYYNHVSVLLEITNKQQVAKKCTKKDKKKIFCFMGGNLKKYPKPFAE